MGSKSSKKKYTFTEYLVGYSAIATMVALPILLVMIIVAQIIILNTPPK
jgi:hypothetical protein